MGRCARMDLPAVVASPCDLLRLVKHLDIAGAEEKIGLDGCYSLLWPESVTEPWLMENVRNIHVDDRDTLKRLCASLTNNTLVVKLQNTCSRVPTRALYGQELVLPVARMKCDSCRRIGDSGSQLSL